MKTKKELLNNKLQQFILEFNLYSADVRNGFLQNNKTMDGECAINFVLHEKRLTSEYFNGFSDANGNRTEGLNQIYLDYFNSTKMVNDKDIFEIEAALENNLNKWKKDLSNFINENYSIPDITFCDSLFDNTIKPVITLESKRILNKLHELQIIFYVPFYKRFFSIFTPVAAAIGFLTGAVEFISSIKPYMGTIKTAFFSMFK